MSTNAEKLMKFAPVLAEIFGGVATSFKELEKKEVQIDHVRTNTYHLEQRFHCILR